MQRLVIAVLLVGALVVVLTVAVAGLRRALSGPTDVAVRGDGAVQKLAYALLIGLILYVSFSGPS